MNKNIGMVLTFIAGVVIGAASAYKVAETKYRNIADEEIADVVEHFSNRKPVETVAEPVANDMKEPEPEPEPSKIQPKVKNSALEYKSEVERIGYDQVNKDAVKPKRGKTKVKEKEPEPIYDPKYQDNIYIISPDEFNTLEGYKVNTYYFSCDNVVVDAECHILDDFEIARTIGHSPLGHFGEYEEDAVHVRNENTQTDYEIILSMKTAEELSEV